MVNSHLDPFDLSQLAPFHWSTRSLVISHLYRIPPYFRTFSCKNYRPVSLTSICCKTLEYIIVSNINWHLASESILVDCQHRYRIQRSCEIRLYIHVVWSESSFSLECHWCLCRYQMSAQWRFRSVCLDMPERSDCVVVQLANRRKIRVEVQRNLDGDTPSICMAAHTALRICGRRVIL